MGKWVHSGLWVVCAFALALSGCEFGRTTGITLNPSYLLSTVSNQTASPATLAYSSNPASYKVATLITANAPVTTGGVPTSYSVSPTLPDGLVLNTATGMVSGTPTAVAAAANYTITASNTAGSATVVLTIAIATNILPPTNLTYSNLAPVFVKGVAATPLAPTSQGGAPTSYAISAALPAGLLFNTTTGVISGTPSVVQAATPFTVTATNAGGSTTVNLSVTVNDLSPATLAYSSNPASYQVATLITANTPTTTGGVPTAYTVTPALPTGLVLNATTGIITGTPTTVTAAANYTIKASNTAGSATVALNIAVVTNILPPTNLTYSNLAPVFTKGVLITALSPTSQGGAPTSYAISAALPTGLAFSTTTGVISGTPTALQAATPYTVTATNSAGSATVNLSITVKDLTPATLAYSSNPASYKVATLITSNTPTTTGGVPTAYTVTPALPSGLVLNATTGIITGTPTAVAAAANYTVTASNTAGSATVALNITVVTNILPPTTLTYSNLAPVFVKGTLITSLTPTNLGGAPTSYAISAALPTGLAFSTTTGTISGTPSVVQAMTPYTVTATNAGGSATVTLAITVNDIPPATLTYSAPQAIYVEGTQITANISLTTGGAITAYTITPALPAGLTFVATSGTIMGTPTAPLLGTVFTVKGTNSGGSITTTLTLGVANLADPNATFAYLQTNLLTPSCVSCHGTGYPYGDFTAYAGVVAQVVVGKPLSSPLYTLTAPGSANPMPPGGTITTTQSFAIMDWIMAGAPSGAVAPSPTPSPSPSAVAGTTFLEGSNDTLRLSSRFYIAATLTDIFGTANTASVQSLILDPDYVNFVGGPCNAYSAMPTTITYGTIDLAPECTSVVAAQAPEVPIAITAREALITRTCNLILSQDAAVLNAASLALGSTVTASTLPAMTAASITQAYGLFFPGRPLDSTSAANLLTLANSGTTSVESWRFPLLTLCYAPDWQIP